MADFQENWNLHVEVERLRDSNKALLKALEILLDDHFAEEQARAAIAQAKGEKT
jgi:hypothetical protein